MLSICVPAREHPKGNAGRTLLQPKSESMEQPQLAPVVISFRDDVIDFARRSVVPLHIEGRRNIDRENWSLSRYFLALEAAGRLEFPISAVHAPPFQSPDFVLAFTSNTVGLEITEATTTGFHNHQLVISERRGSYSDDNDPGWIGDSPETTNAALVISKIRDKARGLATGTWNAADHQDLLIYCDNAPGPGVETRDLISRVRSQLLEAVKQEPEIRAFRHISLIAQDKLIFDVVDACVELRIPVI